MARTAIGLRDSFVALWRGRRVKGAQWSQEPDSLDSIDLLEVERTLLEEGFLDRQFPATALGRGRVVDDCHQGDRGWRAAFSRG